LESKRAHNPNINGCKEENKSMNLFWHTSPPVLSEVRVIRSLVLCVCFVNRCLSFCPFSFGHCIVCPSSIYRFWLPLWYLQTLLILIYIYICTILMQWPSVLKLGDNCILFENFTASIGDLMLQIEFTGNA
jgi:hypothetical protein